MIELAAVSVKSLTLIKDFPEHLLHFGDVGPDCCFAAGFTLDVMRTGDVVGMYMGVDYPFDLEFIFFDIGD